MTKLTRRQVIKASLATIALAPLSYVVSVSWGGYIRRTGLNTLTDKQAAIWEAMGDTIIPDSSGIGITLSEVNFVKMIDEFIGVMPAWAQVRLGMLCFLVEHILPLRGFYFRKFTRLNSGERKSLLDKFDQSTNTGLRGLVRGIKAICQSTFYNSKLVTDKLGIDWKCYQ